MGERADLVDLSPAIGVLAAAPAGGIRQRRGLRVTLLSLAAVVLLLGATVAGGFCYLMLARG
jgi:hypothetical protein